MLLSLLKRLGGNEAMTSPAIYAGTPNKSTRNSARSPILRMEPRTPARRGPVPSHSRVQSTRKKSCRKCVQAKARCDLAKPKCKRCTIRSTTCEYPGHITSNQGARTENNVFHGDLSPLNTLSDISSLHPNLPTLVARPSAAISQNQPHSTLTDSGRPDPDAILDPNFNGLDLEPMTDAEEIRDRWLRPYISDWTGQEPKQLSAHTTQYLTCVLKSYLRNLLDSTVPPFVHSLQQMGSQSPILACCFTLTRMWLTRIPGSEPLVLGAIRGEMEKIGNQVNTSLKKLTYSSLTRHRKLFPMTLTVYAPSKHI